jgi:hypothetical protein
LSWRDEMDVCTTVRECTPDHRRAIEGKQTISGESKAGLIDI